MSAIPRALVGFEKEVPEKLMTYLEDNKDMLNQHEKRYGKAQGFGESWGIRKECLETLCRKFFMACVHDYIDEVARVERTYPLPMFVNAWHNCNIRNSCREGYLQVDTGFACY